MILHRLKYLLVSVSALLFISRTVPAQPALAPLPADSRIQKGTLGSGVTYYMVTNPSAKGYAHIAIVQRDEPLSSDKRDGLDAAFLSRMGIRPGPEGFLSDRDGSTIYNFNDVPFYRPEVLDSTLLYTFARVAESKAQQAVIVSGDIDAPELKKKMDIFSMLVPRMLVKENHWPDYVWEPSLAPFVLSHPSERSEVAVTYAGPRIPFTLMNTAQAIVTDLFGLEFQILLRHRLERNLRDAGLPYGEIGFRSLRSADYGGDERYTVYVTTDPGLLDPVMQVISSTVGEMESFGVTEEEFADAKQVLLPWLRTRARTAPAAEIYVNRCIANFLYGAHLAPYSETLHYFARKNVADSTEAHLFNRFSKALLGQLENLTLEYAGAPDTLDKDESLFYYNLAYLYGSVARTGKQYRWNSADSLGLEVNCPRVRIKSEKPEPISGGVLWTFSNGMRVIFKPVRGSGMFHYALQLNGGLATIPGLKEGEGGYIGDLLSLYDAGGLPAPHFRDLLQASGISLQAEVNLHSMAIQGDAPSDKLGLLVKSLLDLSCNRNLNRSEFLAYSRREALTPSNVSDELSRHLLPGYVYASLRSPSVLSQETQMKADAYFTERFARMNDGVLILSGDLDQDKLKKLLCRYLGGFRVQRGGVSRPVVEYRPLSGTTTYTEKGEDEGVFVLMDAALGMNPDHFYTAQVAVQALESALSASLIPHGFNVSVRPHYTFQPQERFQLEIQCRPLPLEGLPASVKETSPESALTAVRSTIRHCAVTPVADKDLNAWKQKLEVEMKAALADPSGVVTTVLARYAANKDMTSRYSEAISGITAQKVRSFLETLSGGGRIEWIVL